MTDTTAPTPTPPALNALCDTCNRTWNNHKTPTLDHSFQDRPHRPATPEQIHDAYLAAKNAIRSAWQPDVAATEEDVTT